MRELRRVERRAFSGAALGDLHRIFDRLRMVREERRHLIVRLEIHLGALMMERAHLVDGARDADAEEGELALRLLLLHKMNAIGGDEREPKLFGELDEDGVERCVLWEAVILELDEEVVLSVDIEETLERFSSGVWAFLEDGLRDDPCHARREADHALAMLSEELIICAGFASIEALDPGPADDADDILIALLALGEEEKMRGGELALVTAIAIDDGDLSAEDGLHLLAPAGVHELYSRVHISAIRDGDRGHACRLGRFYKLIYAHRPLEHRIFAMDVEVDERPAHRREDSRSGANCCARFSPAL